jgi:excisionase family DNA binding protein
MELKLLLDSETVDHLVSELAGAIKPLILEGGASSSLLTTDQLAQHLNVPKSWVYDRTRLRDEAGGLPCVKVGKYVRFHLPEVLQWLKQKDEPTD